MIIFEITMFTTKNLIALPLLYFSQNSIAILQYFNKLESYWNIAIYCNNSINCNLLQYSLIKRRSDCHLYPPQGNIFVVSIHETMIPPTNKVIGPNYLDVRRISYWGQAFKPDLNIISLITLITPEFDIK